MTRRTIGAILIQLWKDITGLGIMSGTLDGWDWFGHTGGFQGYVSADLRHPGPVI